MNPRLQEKYEQEILPPWPNQLQRKNRLALPRLEKIVVNMGVGAAIQEKKHLESAVEATDSDHRAETDHHQEPQGHRRIPAAGRDVDRLQSDAPPCSDVRVPRSARGPGAAPRT